MKGEVPSAEKRSVARTVRAGLLMGLAYYMSAKLQSEAELVQRFPRPRAEAARQRLQRRWSLEGLDRRVGLLEHGDMRFVEWKKNGTTYVVKTKDISPGKRKYEGPRADVSNKSHVSSSLPGIVTSIAVKEGDAVKKDDLLFLVVAMKMEVRAGEIVKHGLESAHCTARGRAACTGSRSPGGIQMREGRHRVWAAMREDTAGRLWAPVDPGGAKPPAQDGGCG